LRAENRAAQWESPAEAALRISLRVQFTRGEWRWLARILASAGTVVGHESLRIACLMPGGAAEGDQVAKVYGCRVRAKLREARATCGIKTVWGIGYVIEPSAAHELKAWLGLLDA
jgi:DNA-binding response OmpR family regulator